MDPWIFIGGGGGGGFAIIVAWKLLDFILNAFKANRKTIDNELKHIGDVLSTQIETNREILHQQKGLEGCIQHNTEALIAQAATNKELNKTMQTLNEIVHREVLTK